MSIKQGLEVISDTPEQDLSKKKTVNLKTFMEFVALGDSKRGNAKVASETARNVGLCYVLLFSMLPKSQT